jgi:hypothetical protein
MKKLATVIASTVLIGAPALAADMAVEAPPPVTQDFRYLVYYVWSELPPAEKPADIVLRSLKDTPVGTPVEEIKRASSWVPESASGPQLCCAMSRRFRCPLP